MSLVATKSIDMPTPSVPFSKSTPPSSQKALWFGGVRVGQPHPHVRRRPAPVVDKRRRRRVRAQDHRGDFVTEEAVRYQICPRRAYSAVRFGASGMSARKSMTIKTSKTTTWNRHDGNGRGGASGEGFECHDVVALGCHAGYQQVDPPRRFPLAAAVVAAIDIPVSIRAQMDSGTHTSSIVIFVQFVS